MSSDAPTLTDEQIRTLDAQGGADVPAASVDDDDDTTDSDSQDGTDASGRHRRHGLRQQRRRRRRHGRLIGPTGNRPGDGSRPRTMRGRPGAVPS